MNGPGEAREADIGLTGGSPNLLYINGKPDHKLDDEGLVDERSDCAESGQRIQVRCADG